MLVKNIRGQGAIEYLVLLAVVLIVAMVALSLLGYFPSLSSEVQRAQSESYWGGSATPIRVEKSFLSSEFMSNGSTQSNLTMLIRNMENTWITVRSISVSPGHFYDVYDYNGGYLGNASNLNFTLTAAAKKVIVLVATDGSYAPPDGFSVELEFNYSSAYGTPGEQKGAVKLLGESQLTYEEIMIQQGCVLLFGVFWLCP